jgi:hypothetical protein
MKRNQIALNERSREEAAEIRKRRQKKLDSSKQISRVS